MSMSSTHGCVSGFCFAGSNAVDGIYLPIDMNELSSVAHTITEYTPWLQIDLGWSFCISAVKIWNRSMEKKLGTNK